MCRVLLLLLVMLPGLLADHPSGTNPPDFRLQVVPAIVYKVDDPGNTGTSSFVFDIAVNCSTDCALNPISASVELLNGRSVVERQEWTPELLAKIKGVKYRISPDIPVAAPLRMFTLPEAFDLHFYVRIPQALAIGSANVRVQVADANGRRAEQMLTIPIQYYQQKTSLTLPFRGRGVVGIRDQDVSLGKLKHVVTQRSNAAALVLLVTNPQRRVRARSHGPGKVHKHD